jgi:hypothetical protein
MTEPSLSDPQIKHLEFIQTVIGRLANNSSVRRSISCL